MAAGKARLGQRRLQPPYVGISARGAHLVRRRTRTYIFVMVTYSMAFAVAPSPFVTVSLPSLTLTTFEAYAV